MKTRRTWTLNGKTATVEIPGIRRLIDVLREDLGLTGTKEGCGEGECGACTVLLDGEPVAACLIPAAQVPDGARLTTIEGVSRTHAGRVLQQAYIDAGAVQCGFCIPGMILSSYALLQRNPRPTERDIRTALSGNLCRCTGYAKIVAAVHLAARRLQETPK
jgi:carbon-monoxide dehydrogenase small subunit